MVLSEFFIPAIRDLFRGSLLFLLPLGIFSFFGLILTFLAVKSESKGLLRKFLMLTGISSVSFFVGVLLHNAFYALSVVASDVVLLRYFAGGSQVAFFVIAVFVCPVGFLIGAGGSIVLLTKKRKTKEDKTRLNKNYEVL